MQNSYETFVKDLCQAISAASGIGENELHFEKEGGRFAEQGDRLLIEYAEYEDTKEVCALYTEELYGDYRDGVTIEEMVHEILRDIRRAKGSGFHEQAQLLLDYEKVKGKLFIRLLNTDRNEVMLRDGVYKTIGDIALVIYVKVGETDGCITSTMVHRNLIEIWGKDGNMVFKEALLNTYFVSPPRIYRWEKMLFNPDYEGDNFMDMAGIHTLKEIRWGTVSVPQKRPTAQWQSSFREWQRGLVSSWTGIFTWCLPASMK